MILQFDWPVSELSPNSRNRWGKIAAAKAARAMGRWAFVQFCEVNPHEDLSGPLEVQYWFYPPDNRRRDLDNMHGLMKSYQDGVFEALCLDDSMIETVEVRRCKPEKPGRVVMHIYQAESLRY